MHTHTHTLRKGSTGWNLVFVVSAIQAVVATVLWNRYQTSDVVKALNTPGRVLDGTYSFWDSFAEPISEHKADRR